MTSEETQTARDFLRLVERRLTQDIRSAEEVEPIDAQVTRIVRNAKKVSDEKHLRGPEAAFLNKWLPPVLHEALVKWKVVDPCAALLAESHAGLGQLASGKVARPRPYPFDKKWDVPADKVYSRWRGPDANAFVQPCPDFAVKRPFRIVFEGKYFRTGGLESAQKQLVAAIYEALFYLGVPPATAAGREWAYEYACLVAFDASNEQTLWLAWQLIEPLHKRFWEDANLYVTVIGRSSPEGLSATAYEALFGALGFTQFELHKRLLHPRLTNKIYFRRSRAGVVSFAVSERDADLFSAGAWELTIAEQTNDQQSEWMSAVPKRGREVAAFRELLERQA